MGPKVNKDYKRARDLICLLPCCAGYGSSVRPNVALCPLVRDQGVDWLQNPPAGASALRAPFGVWGQTQRWRICLLVVWGGTDVKIPTTIRFMAAKGAHALLPPCPFCGPAKAHPILNCRRTAFELHVLPDHNPGGY